VEKFYGALKSQGLAISKDTVHQLMGYLQDCFLVRTVWMEAASERQRMVNPRKAYPVDPGLIPVFDRTGRSNLGHALETAVLLDLERRRAEVSYVKTSQGFEVDFLARYPSGEEELIQVCADVAAPDTAERELRSLVEAGRQFPQAHKRLLTLTQDGLPREAAVQPPTTTAARGGPTFAGVNLCPLDADRGQKRVKRLCWAPQVHPDLPASHHARTNCIAFCHQGSNLTGTRSRESLKDCLLVRMLLPRFRNN